LGSLPGQALGFSADDIREAIKLGDNDGNGQLDFNEFVTRVTRASSVSHSSASDTAGRQGNDSFPFELMANSYRISKLVDSYNPALREAPSGPPGWRVEARLAKQTTKREGSPSFARHAGPSFKQPRDMPRESPRPPPVPPVPHVPHTQQRGSPRAEGGTSPAARSLRPHAVSPHAGSPQGLPRRQLPPLRTPAASTAASPRATTAPHSGPRAARFRRGASPGGDASLSRTR
jgi:hypothetical protein